MEEPVSPGGGGLEDAGCTEHATRGTNNRRAPGRRTAAWGIRHNAGEHPDAYASAEEASGREPAEAETGASISYVLSFR